MNPLDALIRQRVLPVMKSAGFSKKGRTFQLAAENGDHALLDFHTHAVDPGSIVFDVNITMVPSALWAWVNRQYPEPLRRAPDSSGAMVICPVMPPPEVAHQPDEEMPFRARWAFAEPETRDNCGQDPFIAWARRRPLTGFVLDRDTVHVEGFSAGGGYWRACLSCNAAEAYCEDDDEDFTVEFPTAEAAGPLGGGLGGRRGF